jgi:hypothetical protein
VGTYPNPTIGPGAVGTAEISDVAYTKVTGAPTSLPPSGAASGDLGGTYPGPTVAKLNGAIVGTATATAGNVLIGSGTQWVTQPVTGDGTLSAAGALAVTKVKGAALGTTTPLARGDLLVADATPALVRLPRGSASQVLQSNGTDVVWGASLGGPPSGTASGSLSGTYPGPGIAASAVRGTPSSGGTAREIAKASIWAGDDLIDLSIPTTKLAATAVTDAKINDVAATKLTGTIAQARFPTAPSGLLTANINDAQVTLAKLAAGVTIGTFVSAAAFANTVIGGTAGTIWTLPSLTTRGGVLIVAPTSAGVEIGPSMNGVLVCTWLRAGATIATQHVQAQNTGTARLVVPLPPFVFFDAPAAGAYVYSMTVSANVADVFYRSNAAPGVCFALAFA